MRPFSSVEGATFKGDLYNAGLIKASNASDAAVGISIEDGITLDGKILNYGKIVANETAIDATEAGGHVEAVNFGLIRGDVLLSDGHDIYDGAYGRVKGLVDGGAGNDKLIGGWAKEYLAGGAHDDELTGGHGRDVFVFRETDAASHDVITDFEDRRDKIDVSDFSSSASAISVSNRGPRCRPDLRRGQQRDMLGFDAADLGAGDVLF